MSNDFKPDWMSYKKGLDDGFKNGITVAVASIREYINFADSTMDNEELLESVAKIVNRLTNNGFIQPVTDNPQGTRQP